MKHTCVYQDYYLSSMSSETEDGRFRARVAIVMLSAQRTRSQRFIDLEDYSRQDDADARAIEAGKEWVDAQLLAESRRAPTDFAAL